MSLDDLDDLCGTKDDQNKKSRFSKRLHSPDRSVWDTSPFFPGGSKNEIEKMFEKFKIKLAADEESAFHGDHPVTNVRPAVNDGVTDSDFSPAHSEYSNLIGDTNRAYTSSVDDTHAVNVKDTKQDGEKTGKKHKHKKDKHNKEKKSRHGKSKSKHAAEADSSAAIPAGIQAVPDSSAAIPARMQAVRESVEPTGTHSARQLTMQQSSDSVFSQHNSDDDVPHSYSQSTASVHVPELAELSLPSVHTSCRMNAGFSETVEESNTDEVGSVDLNQLDLSTLELIPQTSEREVCWASLILICFVDTCSVIQFYYVEHSTYFTY